MARAREVVLFVGRSSKRIAVAVVGGGLVVLGLAMLVLPGPGIVVVVAGLAVLATEFVWAAAALEKAKGVASAARSRVKRGR